MSDSDLALEIETLTKENAFLQKRYDNANKEREVLKNENKVLRQELNSMKEFVKKLVLPPPNPTSKPVPETIKNDMQTILDFQSKKIDSLETELASLRSTYEKSKQEDARKTELLAKNEQEISRQKAALKNANDRIQQLEKQLKELTSNSAKEIQDLKQKLAESNAELILAAQRNSELFSNLHSLHSRKPLSQQTQYTNGMINRGKRLGPIQSMQDLNSNGGAEKPQTLFHYRHTNTNK